MIRFLSACCLFTIIAATCFEENIFADEPAGIPENVAQYVSSPSVTLNLWPETPPDGIPDNIGPETWEPGKENPPIVRVSNVAIPTMAFYPAKDPNGACVVIFPGGGFNILAYNHEGSEIADWLNTLGVSAVVVKYRVPRREGVPKHWAALQDAQRAIRMTRSNAEEWKIDPKKIGVLGFSAGGRLAVAAALDYNVKTYEPIDEADKISARPDFAIPIYPAYLMDNEKDYDAEARLSEELNIDKNTPPCFISVANDDVNRGAASARFYIKMKEAGVPCELHIPVAGGHGYGIRRDRGVAAQWNKNCENWMRALEIIP
ncbi:MAG: alpha/beta hydrolase [Thermoguttaceae bacterium]|nr:alpha/beta hydrolase [Thermoguttaceae bacterium]